MSISLRAADPGDDAFLLAVYASTRRQEMAMVPWEESQKLAFLQMQAAAQLDHYQKHFPAAVQQVVLCNARPVGRLYVSRTGEGMRILDLTILPEADEGSAIEKAVLENLQAEAATRDLPVQIYLESFSSALPRFEHLGFARVEPQGIHWLMEWRPATLRATIRGV